MLDTQKELNILNWTTYSQKESLILFTKIVDKVILFLKLDTGNEHENG